ncbi:hypothetical protein BDN70DRAFT_637329 [Pholiota conissans]|uniref:Uncharacterized protein n=1 Tax=Pholiota conissans TaxID=109636 RepID=A0A9P6D6A3_9AGAR|nr:hypothetical protein BDN70DRAFT_637329 [Pholiota conissans]
MHLDGSVHDFIGDRQSLTYSLFTAQCPEGSQMDHLEAMTIDVPPIAATKVSTHGPRGSRREQWRESKGMPPRATSNGMNRQGTVAAKRKAGRSKRRR